MWKFDHADLKYFRGQGDKLTKEANYLKRNQWDQWRAIALAKYSLLYHKTWMRIVFLGLFVFWLFALATYYIFTL